jgi:superfamily I DNA/RNA helicase
MKEYLLAAEDLKDNVDQLKAYNSTGNCVILAGPGSGKTKTITIKIARILEEDLKLPRRAACITYSNACVSELQTRLKNLEIEDGKRILISTVHSFCLTELVLPFGKLARLPVPEPFSVAAPSKATQVFNDSCKKIMGSVQKPWFRTECDRLRRTFLDRQSQDWNNYPNQKKVIQQYEQGLLAQGMIDFDGLVLWGLSLVENNGWVRDSIRAKFPLIIIDEYQDLGLPLHKIVIALLQKSGVRIIAVGDPDQSIYGFTGANPELLRDLSKLNDVEAVNLSLNYRCGEQIILASKSLLKNPPTFKSFDGKKGEVLFYQTNCDLKGQAKIAFEQIIPSLMKANSKMKYGDIAFLYRSMNEAALIAEVADSLGLKYFRLDNGAPIKRSRFIDWLFDLAKFCSGGWETGAITLSQITKIWRNYRKSLTRESDILAAKANLISTLYNNRDRSVTLYAWLKKMESSFVKDIFEQEIGIGDEEESFRKLMDETASGGSLENMTLETFANQGKSPKQINLMTLHSSKGLEFSVVFILGMENGAFPSSMYNTDSKLAEASRLFYVGVTRAKNQVHLMYDRYESPFVTKVRNAIK